MSSLLGNYLLYEFVVSLNRISNNYNPHYCSSSGSRTTTRRCWQWIGDGPNNKLNYLYCCRSRCLYCRGWARSGGGCSEVNRTQLDSSPWTAAETTEAPKGTFIKTRIWSGGVIWGFFCSRHSVEAAEEDEKQNAPLSMRGMSNHIPVVCLRRQMEWISVLPENK